MDVATVVRLALLALCVAAHGEDILIADFEGDDYGDWAVQGQAFGPGPARGTLPGQMQVSGYEGRGLVNSFYGGDVTTGSLTSPPFTIQRPFINFLIGGGKYPGETCMDLLVDGQVVRTATGPNDKPGGSERLNRQAWDVRELLGREAVLRIVDRRTGGWGHINVDQIFQSEEQVAVNATRDLTISKPFFNFPVQSGAPVQKLSVIVDGTPVRELDIELAPGEPDFWVFLDVRCWLGRNATLRVDSLARQSRGLETITQTEKPELGDLYKETYRPQFHFTSRRGWNNDPNGLVYHDGEYHLYYQHNPYGTGWGNMHWGHAVSRDLVHWEELPIALYPVQYGDWCFSGSAVVDSTNTAGFKTGNEDVIVAAYTSTGRGEAIAYSNDRGRTFTDYGANPVVEHSGRDPKVIWYEPGQHWVMAVYDEQPREGQDPGQHIAFYTSTDLKSWELRSRVEGYYECPEVFELPVDGNPADARWVLYAADGAYAVGAFDGKSFTSEGDKIRYNWGNCFYASQTFTNIPKQDGRRIQIAWGTCQMPGMPFNQMMDFPVELSLHRTPEGLRMFAWPVREIESLYAASHEITDVSLAQGDNPLSGLEGELWDISADIEIGTAVEVGFHVRGIPVSYDVGNATLSCAGCSAPVQVCEGRLSLRLLVDRTSIEIFANGGEVYMPVRSIPSDQLKTLDVFARAGKARLVGLQVHELRSAWE